MFLSNSKDKNWNEYFLYHLKIAVAIKEKEWYNILKAQKSVF